MIEFGYSLVFQILNTALVLLIFIGLPVYLIKNHKKGKQMEIKLKRGSSSNLKIVTKHWMQDVVTVNLL